MKRIITTLFSIALITGAFAQDKLNIEKTNTSRFVVGDRTWPANVGEAEVCLWEDDRLAAFSISIDDNMESDIPFWQQMQTDYGFNFTWFVIPNLVNDWGNFSSLLAEGNDIQGHDDRNWTNNIAWQYNSTESTDPDPAVITDVPNFVMNENATETFSFSVSNTAGDPIAITLQWLNDVYVAIETPSFATQTVDGANVTVDLAPVSGDNDAYYLQITADNGVSKTIKRVRVGVVTTLGEYASSIAAAQTGVNDNVTNGNCVTYAYPYGEGVESEAAKLYISARGTHGTPNLADKVNYMNVNSISSVNLLKYGADYYLLPLLDTEAKLWNANYYRGWASTHFHSVGADGQKIKDLFQYLTDKGDSFWVASYTDVAKYSQSYATHSLTVDAVSDSEVKFTLTDQMLNSAFDQTLTVKININDAWTDVAATQNGESVEAVIVENENVKYAFVKAVPDAGQVTVSGSGEVDSDPAVITPIEDQEVKEDETLDVDFSASTSGGDNISFSVVDLPEFATFTDNGDNSANINLVPQFGDAGTYTITVVANNGRSKTNEAFTVTVTSDNVVLFVNATNDGYVSDPAVITVNNPYLAGFMKLGKSAIDGSGNTTSAIIPFQLPVKPGGMKLNSASLKVYVSYGREWVNANVDLYGLPYAASADGNAIYAEDHYAGEFLANQGDRGAVGIEDDYFSKNVDGGVLDTERWEETDEEGDVALVNYINNQYAAGAVAGDWVFLRLSMDNDGMQGAHYFKVEGDDSSTPAALSLVFGPDNALAEFEAETDVAVYPNPVTDKSFTISSDDIANKNVKVDLYNIAGQVVYSNELKASSNSIEVSPNLNNSGLYFVKIAYGSKYLVKKMMFK